MKRISTLALVTLALVLIVMLNVAYAANSSNIKCTCICHCHVTVNINTTGIVKSLERLYEEINITNSLLVNISKELENVTTLLNSTLTVLYSINRTLYAVNKTVFNTAKSIAETPTAIQTIVSRLNTGLNTTRNTNSNGTGISKLFTGISGECPDLPAQLLVGVPELRCFAPSSWLGPHGWVTIVNASVIGFLLAVACWTIITEINSGADPAEAFRKMGGLVLKCCIAGIFLTLLPTIIHTWNVLIYSVTNWYVLTGFLIAWSIMIGLTVLPMLVPGSGLVAALSWVPGSIFQMNIVFTGLFGLMLYCKLLTAFIVQIMLPIGIALQEVRIKALRSLGMLIEGAFWGLLIGSLLGAALTQLIGGMYIHAGEIYLKGMMRLVHAVGLTLQALADYIKCNIFGWIFHCHVDITAIMMKALHEYALGLSDITIQAPLLLVIAILGTITPLAAVALVMWKKFTPLQFLDVMIGASTGINFIAYEYYTALRAKREIAKQVRERLKMRISENKEESK